MVVGLDRFRSHFAGFTDRYVLIGGTAASVAMEREGLEFRATKDLDVVLCVEALDGVFARAFWEFVRQGRYGVCMGSTGRPRFYRFEKPQEPGYPVLLELFSRHPDVLDLPEAATLTPLSIEPSVTSLSAILIDDTCYAWVMAGRIVVNGLSVIPAEILIPLKAKAYRDLAQRRERGEAVDRRDVAKHSNDIYRLFRIVTRERIPALPTLLKVDLSSALDQMVKTPASMKDFGIRGLTQGQVIDQIRDLFGLG